MQQQQQSRVSSSRQRDLHRHWAERGVSEREREGQHRETLPWSSFLQLSLSAGTDDDDDEDYVPGQAPLGQQEETEQGAGGRRQAALLTHSL